MTPESLAEAIRQVLEDEYALATVSDKVIERVTRDIVATIIAAGVKVNEDRS